MPSDPATVNAPSWFSRALATVPDEGEVSVDAAAIRFRAWGPPGGAGVVLVHGGAAHARWWDHVGPMLVGDGLRVVALDLSGHGDSDRRTGYHIDQWSEEVVAAAAAGGIAQAPALVGHSMGGLIVLRAAARHGSDLLGVVVLDSVVHSLTPEERAARGGQAFGPLRVYPSRAAAVARFRTLPDQRTLPFVRDHVARTSVREVQGGWSWKFDPLVFQHDPVLSETVLPVGAPTILMPAEFGLTAGEERGTVVDQQGVEVPTIEIPGAAHHVMLDSPLALITSLRALLTAWRRWPPRN